MERLTTRHNGVIMDKMTNYEFFKSIGLCPRCGKNKPFENYVFCAECLEKIALSNEKYRKPKSKIYDQRYEGKRKQKREERKRKGLCIRCGKPATHGQLCDYHWNHRKELRKKERSGREYGQSFRERMEAGTCMYCGAPQVPGYKFCKDCLPKRQEVARQMGQDKNSKMRKEVGSWWKISKLIHSENI